MAIDDVSLLLRNFLNPSIKGLIYSANGGWFTTVKSDKKFGFISSDKDYLVPI